eukprot:CAMPEP_0178452694 /NCGR_PEP_ID=MMETSP0689_2-20121128/44385_1 /TAXON_ID=160604 /ORGANISM="Amphidinium massartii, Strain CS-259" /LENGTH=114 /DNA_ID=CAMNT_0020078425 /DNA_START=26 /DNA_END=371 /DNA_ORIENTATION=-
MIRQLAALCDGLAKLPVLRGLEELDKRNKAGTSLAARVSEAEIRRRFALPRSRLAAPRPLPSPARGRPAPHAAIKSFVWKKWKRSVSFSSARTFSRSCLITALASSPRKSLITR